MAGYKDGRHYNGQKEIVIPRWNAVYTVLEKGLMQKMRKGEPYWKLRDKVEWDITKSTSLQIMKYSGIRIPEELKEKLEDYSSIKVGFDINKNSLYLILSYKPDAQIKQRAFRRYPVIAGRENLGTRDSKEAVEKAKKLLKNRKRLNEIIDDFIKTGITVGEMHGKPYIPSLQYNYNIDGWVIR